MARAGVGREGVTSISPSSSKNVGGAARECEGEEGERPGAKEASCPTRWRKKMKLDDGDGLPSKTGSVATHESSRLIPMDLAEVDADGGGGAGLGADEGEVGPATALSKRVAPGTPPAQVIPHPEDGMRGSLSPPPAPRKIYPKRDLRKARKEVARRLEF